MSQRAPERIDKVRGQALAARFDRAQVSKEVDSALGAVPPIGPSTAGCRWNNEQMSAKMFRISSSTCLALDVIRWLRLSWRHSASSLAV